ncbi:hypothetical protein Adt_27444 [Abeliophyllum distichum]|uniref:Uncharacterized protein n=1 Tax=Abeliophyllum distichum TaxID=126358 RepID=A0ABD1RTU5_9LAMI
MMQQPENSTQVSQNGQDLRAKRKIYFGVAHGNSYSSGDVEEINTDHGLDENPCSKCLPKGEEDRWAVTVMEVDVDFKLKVTILKRLSHLASRNNKGADCNLQLGGRKASFHDTRKAITEAEADQDKCIE